MARPRAFNNGEVDALLSIMRKHGVGGFKFRGLEVSFAPSAFTGDSDTDLDPFVAAEKVKSAVEQFKKINDEDRLNLEWSV